MTLKNSQAVYACVNEKEAFAPAEIVEQSICISKNIKEVIAIMCK